MKNHTFDKIHAAILAAKSILVASHYRPDADALGSCLAAALWLRSLHIPVTVWNEDGCPEKFHYLPHSNLLTTPSPHNPPFDLLLLLDTATPKRLGSTIEALLPTTPSINIDHHVTNENYATYNYIDPEAPATGQILFDFFRYIHAPISPSIATNLFAAISTDTGSFQYDRTSPHTFEVAAELVRLGVDVPTLSRQIYQSYPRRRLDLLRHCLNTCQFVENNRAVAIALPYSVQQQLHLLPGDTEGILDVFRSIDSVIASVFFEENPDGSIRISARSKHTELDVSKICKLFGGGGHLLAAGAKTHGSLAEIQNSFLLALAHEIRKLP